MGGGDDNQTNSWRLAEDPAYGEEMDPVFDLLLNGYPDQ